jgi:hypothetical protein
MTVIDEIAAERRRQIEGEGWSVDHDDAHREGELAMAAAHYAMNSSVGSRFVAQGKIPAEAIDASVSRCPPVSGWPWHPTWWKPKGRRRDLIRAAALLVAEIERLDRAVVSKDEP